MKKVFKKALSAILALSTLGSVSAISTSAIEGGYSRFVNEDGTYNIEEFEEVIKEHNDEWLSYTKWQDKKPDNGRAYYGRRIGCAWNDMGNAEEVISWGSFETNTATMEKFEKFFYENFETESIDGLDYVTLDGNKYEYHFNEDNEKGWKGDFFYNCPTMVYSPTNFIMLDGSDAFRYTVINENGEKEVVNPDGLSYSEMLDVAYKCMELQKDVLFVNSFECFLEYHENGEFGDVAFEDVSIEDMIKCHVNHVVKEKYEEFFEYYIVKGDFDESGTVDIHDLGILKKHILGVSEMTPGQQMLASTNGGFEPDIRDVTKVNQYIIKAIDTL